MSSIEIEIIPDDDKLYLRVHKTNLDLNVLDDTLKIKLVAFDQKGDDGLSVNWSKYSSKNDTIKMAKNPSDNGVVSFVVKLIRKIPLRVIHNPINFPTLNQSHSLILDIPPRKPNDLGVRVKMRDICNWEILYKE
jgi:hypothetical protein